jgi:prepilin-type N-terminal cleavage/methylation domain-containing protein
MKMDKEQSTISKAQKTMDKNHSGFTIIELLIATTIFSIVLVVIVASFLQIGRMFYKGVSINNTNESTRALVDDISTDVRLADSPNIPQGVETVAGVTKKYFCVGQHRYTYILNKQVKDSVATLAKNMQAGLIQDVTGGACQQPSSLDGNNARQVLGPDMQLNALDITQTGSSVIIHAHIIFYGVDDSVFTPSVNDPAAYCSGSLLGTQFCAMADIKTNVTLGF